MRSCMAIRATGDGPVKPPRVDCPLPDDWVPYASSRKIPVLVDWIGPGEVMVRVGERVTVVRIAEGMHDLLLSAPAVRQQALDEIGRFVRGYLDSLVAK